MKNTILLLSIILISIIFLLSCQKPTTTTNQVIRNSTERKIEIHYKHNNQWNYSTTISKNDSILFSDSSIGIIKPSIFLYGQLKIIYNDTIAIIHGDSENSVKRDITKLESFTGGVVYETSHYIEYKYEYTFTEADYQEALERHLQNKAAK